jgi:hypothetical protein
MMFYWKHHDMRTTLTLDDDLAERLKAEVHRTRRPFRAVVNETIRAGLATRRSSRSPQPFRVVARDLGELRPGLSVDNVAELLEQVEGPRHR